MTGDDIKTDELVVLDILSGNIDAFEQIMLRYEAKLLRYVTYLIHNRTLASDVVQETFIKSYQNLNSFNSKYKFSSWIYRIAHNEAINAIKKAGYDSGNDVELLPDDDYAKNLEDLLDNQILKNNIDECLSKLRPKYREIIQLIYFENMKYEDISDVLHIPTSTVGVWASRAKQQLKEICKQKGVIR